MGPPLILTGNQRSGTTFLAELFASHPRSAFGVEDGVIRAAIIWFRWLRERSELLPYARFNEFLRLIEIRDGEQYRDARTRMETLLRSDFDEGHLDFKHRSTDIDAFIAEICHRFYNQPPIDPVGEDRTAASIEFWGDKYPEYCFMLDEIESVFAGARFVFLVRHPHSCAEAHARRLDDVARNFGKSMRDVEDCVVQWLVWNRQWINFRDRIPTERRLEIRYEDLIVDTERTIEQMSCFIGSDLTDSPAYQPFLDARRPEKLEDHRRSPHHDEIVELCHTPEMVEMAARFGYDLA